MAACENGCLAAVKVLLSATGIDVNIKNSEVCSFLMGFFVLLEDCS
jgi:hypothetical protein